MIAAVEDSGTGTTTAPNATDFSVIEKNALKVRKENDELVALVNELEERITAAKRELMPKIRKGLAKLTVSSGDLLAEVTLSRHLFQEPKTQIFHGVKVGWPKSRGGLEIPDAKRTIERAEKLLTKEQCDMVVNVKKELRKKPLGALPVDTLKKLGVNVRDAGEYALVSVTEGDVAELVAKMLKAETEQSDQRDAGPEV